jgi:hypothetical protein
VPNSAGGATYTVTEGALPANYSLTGLTCNDSDSGADASTATATLVVDSGETVHCTYTNTYTPPPVQPAAPPAQQVLGERIEPGSARIAGASGCVARKFSVKVSGKQILRVEFRIDGKKRATVSKPDSKGRFVFKVDPKKFKSGSHLLVAKSVFNAASNTNAKTMKLRFARCVRRTAPAFTG